MDRKAREYLLSFVTIDPPPFPCVALSRSRINNLPQSPGILTHRVSPDLRLSGLLFESQPYACSPSVDMLSFPVYRVEHAQKEIAHSIAPNFFIRSNH